MQLLTKLELEMLALMAKGLSTTKIALVMNRSVHTINNHRRNMLQKTGLPNVTALAAFAVKAGWIEFEWIQN